ncbi:hypothetical protein [Paludibaculum fermentans]|uniref:Uncharacterized protein n=1 Tax=Paludibaculum fermentans TaxID=1473598 RepID=A0A7S7SIM5_PALFE|nr:hypothetical protein [Paludibaculum fermentans]QOY85105.1 hypothetical protein IRI77_19920 [Paludibaculum fermentans]
MLKLTRSEQARINGARSRGPVTAEGKSRSAHNSYKHGRYARPGAGAVHTVLLGNEDAGGFNDLLARRMQDLLPTSSFEITLVRELCAIEWKLDRMQAVETRALNLQITVESDAIRNAAGSLRGVAPIDTICAAYAGLLGSSPLLTHAAREFTRLQKARRDALNAFVSLRKHPKIFKQSQEPSVFQELDFWNEPANQQLEPTAQQPAAAPGPLEPAAGTMADTPPARSSAEPGRIEGSPAA